MTETAAETIDGAPTYKLFIDGEWVRSSRNTVVDDVKGGGDPREPLASLPLLRMDPPSRSLAVAEAHVASWWDPSGSTEC